MHPILAVLLVASTFTIYAPSSKQLPHIEALTDRGPIVEMIVRCRVGTAIVSYSKIEKLYCGPRGACSRDRDAVIARLCA